MVSPELFKTYPPFPDDIPTVPVPQISLAKLTAGDEAEACRMFTACTSKGFFRLNLQGDPVGEKFIQSNITIFEVAKELFDLSLEDKMKYKTVAPHKLLGYKGLGVAKTEKGEGDRCEFYNVGLNDILNDDESFHSNNPPTVTSNRSNMLSYLNEANPIIQLILTILNTQLNLPPGTLSSLQPLSAPSGTNLRVIHFPPQQPGTQRTSMVQHTDFGILTIVSNVLGGLEIPEHDSPDDPSCVRGKWIYIKPEPNCVIINIGDALVEWTGGILRSSLHRVTFAPGEQGLCNRYSIAYLIRPETNASMKRLAGGFIPSVEEGEQDLDVTAAEWERRRVIALRDGSEIMQSRGGKGLVVKIPIMAS